MSDPEVSQETLIELEKEKPGWYSWAVSVGASVLSALLAATVAICVNAQATEKIEQQRLDTDRKWCAILVPLDERQRSIENPTASQQQFAHAISELRAQLRCPPTQ